MELKQLVEFAKLHNLRTVRYKDLEIEFFEPVKPIPQENVVPTPPTLREPSEDELLFYSTETFDHLREERDDAKN